MAEGDAEAAEYYKIYSEDPERAAVRRQLEALRKRLKNKTTLMIGTDSAPFTLLSTDFMNSKESENIQ